MLELFAMVPDPDPMTEALKTSGPAGALIVLLGVLIKAWLLDLKSAIGRVETQQGAHSITVAQQSVKLENLERRVAEIERKAGAS